MNDIRDKDSLLIQQLFINDLNMSKFKNPKRHFLIVLAQCTYWLNMCDI